MTADADTVREVFMAGFAASCEGYNGEYPFDGDEAAIDSALDGLFKAWIADRAVLAGGS